MESIPTLIQDLALILAVAGVVTIVFKKLKQPLVLGYIVAGFIAGPHFVYTPSVHDVNNIDVWAQIGINCTVVYTGVGVQFQKNHQNGRRAGYSSVDYHFLYDVFG